MRFCFKFIFNLKFGNRYMQIVSFFSYKTIFASIFKNLYYEN